MDHLPRLLNAFGESRRAKAECVVRAAVARHLAQLRRVEARQQERSDLAELIEMSARIAEAPFIADPFALARELQRLCEEGVEAHKVAHALIAIKACAGPATPKAIKACEVKARKWRERYLHRRVTG